jgi:tetratricopeptide (TPR) repeat protein
MFVDQGHAAPAFAEQACACLFQLLPTDAAAKVAAAVVSPDRGMKDGSGEVFARVRAQCRANTCAGPTPSDDTCDFKIAWDAEFQGDHARAIEKYSQFIKNHPELPAAISNRGQIYLKTGSYELAIADLEKAVAMMGNFNNGDLHLAHAYHLVGRDRDAAALIDNAVKARPFNSYGFLFRAEIHEALGRQQDAIADYKEALKIGSTLGDILGPAKAGLKRLGAE